MFGFSKWKNPLDKLSKEDRAIFYELGGSDNDLVMLCAIKLVINLTKKLKERSIIC